MEQEIRDVDSKTTWQEKEFTFWGHNVNSVDTRAVLC